MVGNAKKWDEAKRRYRIYLKLEKRLSEHTVEAYMRDVEQFYAFLQRWWDVPPGKVETTMIRRYMAWLFDRERAKTTQARSLSGIRSFFNFLLVEERIDVSPAEFVESPKAGRRLPEVLAVEEIDRLIAAADGPTTKGRRDSAMLEVLYSCGLRVSELTLAAHAGPLLRRGIRAGGRQGRQAADRARQRHGPRTDHALPRPAGAGPQRRGRRSFSTTAAAGSRA